MSNFNSILFFKHFCMHLFCGFVHTRRKKNSYAAEYTHHIYFLKRYFIVPLAVLPPTEQSCQPQSEIVLVLISEKQSLQSLWNHQVGHSAAVSYLPWYWWAILALRGFSLLKAVTIYSVSLSWVPKRFDMPFKGFFFLYFLFLSCLSNTIHANVIAAPLLWHPKQQDSITDTLCPHLHSGWCLQRNRTIPFIWCICIISSFQRCSPINISAWAKSAPYKRENK